MADEPIDARSSMALTVERARRAFIDGGVDPFAAVAPHIRRSWQRSLALLREAGPAEPVSRVVLAERRDAAALLLRCALPELDALAAHAADQGCVVILSDASGLILEEAGSADFLPKAQRVALEPGVEWSESRRGTNAIGTALAEREVVLVSGAEHYLPENGILGCAAAPIVDARGQLLGVLDISGESVGVDAHALGLVRLAATQIEHRMLSQFGNGELVRFHVRPGLLGTAREGLLAVTDGAIVGLNRCAASLLGAAWHELLGRPVGQLLGPRWPRLLDTPGLVNAPGGWQWAVVVERRTPRRWAVASGPTAPDAPASDSATAQVASDPPIRVDAADPVEPMLVRAVRVIDAGLAVLIGGETGTGKDWFARRLHAASQRAAGPFVAVNCASLPDTLIEAELFGYEEGAFTGARRRGMSGRVREADRGTLFLDEIGDMPLALQTRLLRVLEERKVRPLGAEADVPVNFRLVCASHRDLEAMAAEGKFRADLLYRLRGYEVQLPPLRERADRRALILRLFGEAGASERALALSPAAFERLDRHPWPGNLRELLSTLGCIVALADPGATIDLPDLPPAISRTSRSSRLPTVREFAQANQAATLDGLTREAIRQALAAHAGNVAAAARSLGVHRSTLYRHVARSRLEA